MALAQNASLQNAARKQVVEFTAVNVNPTKTKIEPGDTLKYTYLIWSDSEAPTEFDSVTIRLSVKDFSDINPDLQFPSLIPTSFSLDSLPGRPFPQFRIVNGEELPAIFPVTIDTTATTPDTIITVSFFLDSLKKHPVPVPEFPDSTIAVSDTLGFMFTYIVAQIPQNVKCARLQAGIQDEFISYDSIDRKFASLGGPGSVPVSIDTQSDFDWLMAVNDITQGDNTTVEVKKIDTLRIRIDYKNNGNISDFAQFRVFLPFLGAVTWEVNPVNLPPGVTIRETNMADDFIEFFDPIVIAGEDTSRYIIVDVSYIINTLREGLGGRQVEVELIARCDTEAQDGEDQDIPVDFGLANLVSVNKESVQRIVRPGETVTYTVTIRREDQEIRIDSVIVRDVISHTAGVDSIIYNGAIPELVNSDPGNLEFVFRNFQRDTSFSYQIVLKPDFFEAAGFGAFFCDSLFLTNRLTATAFAPTPEDEIVDNEDQTVVIVRGLGDIARLRIIEPIDLSSVRAGETLQFIAVWENVSDIVPTGAFTVTQNLPEFFSAPFEIFTSSANASVNFESAGNRIVLRDSVGLSLGEADTLLFKMTLLNDAASVCAADSVASSATIQLDGIDCDLSNNSDALQLIIPSSNRILTLTLAADMNSVLPDETVNFTLTYEAAGLAPSKNIEITLNLPDSVEYVSSEPAPDSIAADLLVWRFAELSPADLQQTIENLILKFGGRLACAADSFSFTATINSNPEPCTPPETDMLTIDMPQVNNVTILSISASPDSSQALQTVADQRIDYTILVRNESNKAVTNATITNTLPDPTKFSIDSASISPTGMLTGDIIIWEKVQIDSLDSVSFTFGGTLLGVLYCDPDSLVNSVLAESGLSCPENRSRYIHKIAASDTGSQRALDILSVRLVEESHNVTQLRDGIVDAFEPVVFEVDITIDTTVDITSFDLFGRQLGAADSTKLDSLPGNPMTIIAGDTATFRFSVPNSFFQSIVSDSLVISGKAITNLHCGQTFRREPDEPFPLYMHPELNIEVVLEDTTGDGLVAPGELVSANVTLTNPSRLFPGRDDTLHLTLSIDRGNTTIQLEAPNQTDSPTDLTFAVPRLDPNNQQVTWTVKFRLPNSVPAGSKIMAMTLFNYSAFDQASVFQNVNSETVFAEIEVEFVCGPRPKTFIPSVHGSLRFMPDDNQSVTLLDVDGNKVWSGTTIETWDGLSSGGRPLPPGVYIYVIGNVLCKGVLVLMR